MARTPRHPRLPHVASAANLGRLLEGSELSLVFFTAASCATCHVADALAERLADRFHRPGSPVAVVMLDAQAHPRAAARFGVEILPTVLLARRGAAVERWTGLVGEQALCAALARVQAGGSPAGGSVGDGVAS